MKRLTIFAALAWVTSAVASAADAPPVFLWFEPEWFAGVEGRFSYWTGAPKATGTWGIAGPGISAEWTQGGESEWNSIGAAAEETKAQCQRDFIVPRAGLYKLWVRYVDHRRASEPFQVRVVQGNKTVGGGELGVEPVVPAGDEYELYWGFSFGWGRLDARLAAGPARLVLAIDKPADAWRQIDVVLLTDDADFTPVGRTKPPFGYLATMTKTPRDAAAWRGAGSSLETGTAWRRPQVGGRDFSMWTGVDATAKWWTEQNLQTLTLYDLLFEGTPPRDIRDKFALQFAGRTDLPIMSWPNLLAGYYLGSTPDLSSDSPLRTWIERTKTPFYILTNYARTKYTDQTGPATFAALSGPLSEQFMGFIHGEAIGTGGVQTLHEPAGDSRRAHVDALAKSLLAQQAEAWSKIFLTSVPEDFWSRGISCLSCDSIALAHLFHEMGSRLVGYEEDATNVHVPMRIAFERGAARQYEGGWINYASGNFGDACNYFSQNPVVPRGAPGWFHSKYAITDGVTASWYRKMYYLNYLSGASAIFWEQGLANQWILPGPGKHPIQLSPFGRATEDFQAFVNRLPDRGEPCTPLAFLLNYGHSYERVNYHCKMLGVFAENRADLELRELFNVAWYPSGVLEGFPAAPDVQSMPGSTYGNIFDVLVDRPGRREAIFNYPVVWAAGDVQLDGPWHATLDDYVRRGGTLVVNVDAARKLPEKLLGVQLKSEKLRAESWAPVDESPLAATPFEVVAATTAGATVLATARGTGLATAGDGTPLVTRHTVGKGSVILSLVPGMLGIDERAHLALPWIMNGVTAGLLPVEVLLASGNRPEGEVMYQVNRTRDGYLVLVINNRGLDKTQSGVARVDRRAVADVVIRTALPVKSAREYTADRDVPLEKSGTAQQVRLSVHPGDIQVLQLVVK